jgi:hypothetical protein
MAALIAPGPALTEGSKSTTTSIVQFASLSARCNQTGVSGCGTVAYRLDLGKKCHLP